MDNFAGSMYARVTERILLSLENGVVPWRRPWQLSTDSAGNRLWQPRNAITERVYRGVNILLLGLTEYADPRWLTFQQAKAAGGTVRKGEKGTEIIFWKVLDQQDDKGRISQMPLLRTFHVFNITQIDGLTLPSLTPAASEPTKQEPNTAAEMLIANFLDKPQVVHGGDRACYTPCFDLVSMPFPAQFENSEAFYGTLFHEFVHATGHASRLDRAGISGSAGEPRTVERYGREELIAEMGAAFLCAEAGIDARLPQSAAYLQNWMTAIKADPKAVIVAAGAAQKAADFILIGKVEASVEAETVIPTVPVAQSNQTTVGTLNWRF